MFPVGLCDRNPSIQKSLVGIIVSQEAAAIVSGIRSNTSFSIDCPVVTCKFFHGMSRGLYVSTRPSSETYGPDGDFKP